MFERKPPLTMNAVLSISRGLPDGRSKQAVWRATARLRLIALLLALVFTVTTSGAAAPGVLEIGAGSAPALALNRSRLPVIVYSSDSLVLARCSEPACPSVALSSIPGTRYGVQPSLALTATGQPVISYYDTANRDLVLAVCGDASCTTATTTVIDSGGDVGQYSSIQLTVGGTPVISYYDTSKGDLMLATCGNLLCTSRTLQRVDRAHNVGQFTSLRLNRSGRAVISYYDVSSGNLKLAVCANASCSQSTTTRVDSDGDVGQYTALALNSSGNPVISYYDATRGDLKLAVCSNPTCTTATLQTIDQTGTVGQYTALALDASDRPAISYLAVSQQLVRLAVCADVTCAQRQLTDLGSGSAAHTAVAQRDPRGIYVAFTSGSGRVVLYANIPAPTGCYIDAPSSVAEGTTFSVSVRCDGLTVPVYGFEIGLRAAGSALPVAPTYTPGSFVTEAGQNVLVGSNRLDRYAVSRRGPATFATGSFSLASVDYTAPPTQGTTTITLALDTLLLGDIFGAALDVPIIPSVVIQVTDVSAAAGS